jgi:large subunit ribosomal protein L21
MEAIIKISGRQYRLSDGQRLEVDRLSTPVGENVTFGEVMAVTDGGISTFGTPHVEGASVAAKVVGTSRGKKILVYKYKAKKRYRRTQGARADYSVLEVVSVSGPSKGRTRSEAKAEPKAAVEAPAAETTKDKEAE